MEFVFFNWISIVFTDVRKSELIKFFTFDGWEFITSFIANGIVKQVSTTIANITIRLSLVFIDDRI